MTAIQQSLVTGNQAQNRSEGDVSHARLQAINNSTGEAGSSTVNISWQAVMRLSAFEQQRIHEQRKIKSNSGSSSQTGIQHFADESLIEQNQATNPLQNLSVLPANIAAMVAEIEQNLVTTTEPGYKHLRHLLANQIDIQSSALSEPQQLQEIVRKEKFFLERRKAFMDSSEFQSYSQVLNQFSNILQREFSL